MGVVDARIDDADDAATSSRRDVPGRRGIDVGARNAAAAHRIEAVVEQTPQARERGIVGDAEEPDHVVRLGVFHVGILREQCEQLGRPQAPRAHSLHAAPVDRFDSVGVSGGLDRAVVRADAVIPVLEQDLALDDFGAVQPRDVATAPMAPG
ncbi:MAG TPA: hypothetical protein VGQ37_27715 [Vicinamibacterales bacterium]|nr:hypothetical protein [Vicinamibacterales bacterium]